jgi:hypothetical protein
MPTAEEYALQFVYRPARDNRDLRTFKAYRIRGGRPTEETYDVRCHLYNGSWWSALMEHSQFSHLPIPRAGETTFKRWNGPDKLWDSIGAIEWLSDWRAKITIGSSPTVRLGKHPYFHSQP